MIDKALTKGTAKTVLPWLETSLGGLVVLVTGLRAVGAARWAQMIRTHTTQLKSGSVGVQGRLPSPARFGAHELEGLPAPVQRYFRALLTDGQPIIAAAFIEMTGTMVAAMTLRAWLQRAPLLGHFALTFAWSPGRAGRCRRPSSRRCPGLRPG